MLTLAEYGKACSMMQDLWKKSFDRLTATSTQAIINGDKTSIDNAKLEAEKHMIRKEVVDECIKVISHYTDWSKDVETDKKTNDKTK